MLDAICVYDKFPTGIPMGAHGIPWAPVSHPTIGLQQKVPGLLT